MSSSRTNRNTYELVKPYRSLLFFSAPCEHRAAGIFNTATCSMIEKDTADVAYRFLQSRQGAKNSLIEACGWSIDLIAMGILCKMGRVPAKIALPILFSISAHIPPNIGNYIRYNKIQKNTEDWLIDIIKVEKFNEIASMEYNKIGIENLNRFFDREKVDTSSIKDKANNKTEILPWWKCR